MRQIRIKEIEEPDFGCEGRPQGESVFVKIWAEDAGTGEEIVCRREEKALWQSGIDEGMRVWMDERGELRRRKLAVFFPGWRHSTDRALLYYPEKLCRNLGYETVLLHYDYPRDRKTENFSFEQTEEQAWKTVQTELDSRKLNDYQEILFVSKSMGTVLAGKAEREYGLTGVRHCFLTPLPQTVKYFKEQGQLVVAGTKDPYFPVEDLESVCEKREMRYYLVENVGHNLEVDEIQGTLWILTEVMRQIENFIRWESRPPL